MRDVILHYHIFKNAGTSIDSSLSASFGNRWLSFDRDPIWTNITSQQLFEFIEDHPDLRALSSHQSRWPAPAGARLRVYPLVLLRHPIDRIHSIYTYGVRVGDATAAGRTFPEYVDWLLGPDGSIVARSFQTLFLSDDDHLRQPPDDVPTEATPAHFESARRRLDTLEVFGIVERFEESLAVFGHWLAPAFPDLVLEPHRENVSHDRAVSLESRLSLLGEELGRRRTRRVMRVNEADLELWQYAMDRFEERLAGHLAAPG